MGRVRSKCDPSLDRLVALKRFLWRPHQRQNIMYLTRPFKKMHWTPRDIGASLRSRDNAATTCTGETSRSAPNLASIKSTPPQVEPRRAPQAPTDDALWAMFAFLDDTCELQLLRNRVDHIDSGLAVLQRPHVHNLLRGKIRQAFLWNHLIHFSTLLEKLQCRINPLCSRPPMQRPCPDSVPRVGFIDAHFGENTVPKILAMAHTDLASFSFIKYWTRGTRVYQHHSGA